METDWLIISQPSRKRSSGPNPMHKKCSSFVRTRFGIYRIEFRILYLYIMYAMHAYLPPLLVFILLKRKSEVL